MTLAVLALVALLFSATPATAEPISAAVVAFFSLTGTAAAVATFVVNTVLYTAATWAANKILGPRTPALAAQERQASVLQLAIGEVSREAIFGEAATGGSLLGAFNYGGEHGTDWVVKVIAIADHRCHALRGVYVNDTYVGFAGSGEVAGYSGQLVIHWRDGSVGQTFPSDLLSAWQSSPLHADSAPTTTAPYKGMAYVVVAYKADAPDAEDPIWTGHPQFLWQVRGAYCYDPRKDTTVGGEGAHRWNDPATWEWTRNPAVCRYNWVRGIYALDQVDDPTMLLVGRGLSAVEAPPARVFAYANLCDDLVDDGAGGEEPRYLVDGVIRATDTYVAVEEMFAAATAGQIIQPEGGIEVEPGQAKTPVFEITDDDLLSGRPLEFSEFGSDADRINTVIPRYVEPLQKWQDHAGPVQRDEADLIADGGPREETLPLTLVTRATQAQRVAQIRRRRARLERRARIPVGPRFAEAEEGDWIVWTSARHTGGQPVAFLITSVSQDQGWACVWTLEEISFEAFGFGGSPLPATGGQTPTPPAGALALSGVDAEAIEIEGETGALIPAIRMTWTAPVDPAINRIRAEVRRAGANDTAPTVTEAVNAGVMLLTNGVAPDSSLEARLVPLGGPGRPVVPSNWIPVFTGNLVSTGVREIGGYTPAGLLAYLDGVSAQGSSLTAAVLEAYLRLDEDRVQLLTETFHAGRRVKRVLIDEDEMWEERDRSLWTRVKGIAVQGEDGESMILQKDTLIWDEGEGSTLAAHLEAVVSTIGDNLAAAIEETRTWVNSESAGATFLQQLEVAFGTTFTGAITTLAQVTSDFGASHTLSLNVGGKISGVVNQNDGTTSSAIFLVDEFGVSDGTTDYYLFSISDGWVNAPFLRAGDIQANTITAEKIVGGAVSNLSADTESSGTGIGAIPIHALGHVHWSDGGQHAVNVACTVAQTGGGVSGVIAVLYCNGIEVGRGSTAFQGPFQQTIPIIGLHTPGPGSATYQVTCTQTGGSTGSNAHVQTTIVVTELKK